MSRRDIDEGGCGTAGGVGLVIARSPCDEAIQTASADAALDCFASLAMTRETNYGFRIDAPVVLRLSRSICALAASFSA
ncbi:hypothetical protein FXV83_22325 [Bradyrhizobium hipponense]|uniref:Uncharacterized protein n=1 Tax=Bradyrhizobium hipponense TaxID=2605638 RepID=A0A5S4YIZ1_9BRAD|nr:hypothetical protein FXV83_22325 [Bradyrhizobium hipponense]